MDWRVCCSPRALATPRPGLPYQLRCDASGFAANHSCGNCIPCRTPRPSRPKLGDHFDDIYTNAEGTSLSQREPLDDNPNHLEREQAGPRCSPRKYTPVANSGPCDRDAGATVGGLSATRPPHGMPSALHLGTGAVPNAHASGRIDWDAAALSKLWQLHTLPDTTTIWT